MVGGPQTAAPPLRQEIVGGLTTFLTMSYIIVVNPRILSTEGTGMPFSGVLTATVLLALSMTLLMGLWAKLPFAVAPGMGLNAFFTFQIVLADHVPWRAALGIVAWSGALFVLVSATPLRVSIARAKKEARQSAAAPHAGRGLDLEAGAQRRRDRHGIASWCSAGSRARCRPAGGASWWSRTCSRSGSRPPTS
jgi:hypothetical protein